MPPGGQLARISGIPSNNLVAGSFTSHSCDSKTCTFLWEYISLSYSYSVILLGYLLCLSWCQSR